MDLPNNEDMIVGHQVMTAKHYKNNIQYNWDILRRTCQGPSLAENQGQERYSLVFYFSSYVGMQGSGVYYLTN